MHIAIRQFETVDNADEGSASAITAPLDACRIP